MSPTETEPSFSHSECTTKSVTYYKIHSQKFFSEWDFRKCVHYWFWGLHEPYLLFSRASFVPIFPDLLKRFHTYPGSQKFRFSDIYQNFPKYYVNLIKGSWGQFWPQRSKTRYYFLIGWTYSFIFYLILTNTEAFWNATLLLPSLFW